MIPTLPGIMSTRLAARRIHTHRVRLGLSPEQYGIRIGVSGQTVRNVEGGRIPFRSTQLKFAVDLGCEVDEVFPLFGSRRPASLVAA